jgi:hypothetical protein
LLRLRRGRPARSFVPSHRLVSLRARSRDVPRRVITVSHRHPTARSIRSTRVPRFPRSRAFENPKILPNPEIASIVLDRRASRRARRVIALAHRAIARPIYRRIAR